MASDLSKIFSKLHGKIFSMFFSRSLIQVNTVLNMQRMKKGTTLLKKLLEDTFHQIKKRKELIVQEMDIQYMTVAKENLITTNYAPGLEIN